MHGFHKGMGCCCKGEDTDGVMDCCGSGKPKDKKRYAKMLTIHKEFLQEKLSYINEELEKLSKE